jgi:hypothetical protein
VRVTGGSSGLIEASQTGSPPKASFQRFTVKPTRASSPTDETTSAKCSLSLTCTARAAGCASASAWSWPNRWRVFQQRQRVLPRVASHLAHPVEDLAFLTLALVPIPRRQRAHQVMPTGSLHCLTDLTFGRILI